MKLTCLKGDLIEIFNQGKVDIIAHGANCRNVMDAGIAKQIKDKYPEAFYADRYVDIPEGIWRLGKMSYTEDQTIFNLYTQEEPGPNANLCAIKLSLKLLARYTRNLTVGLPRIGCGIGGLNWEDVKPIIIEELKNCKEIILVEYETKKLDKGEEDIEKQN